MFNIIKYEEFYFAIFLYANVIFDSRIVPPTPPFQKKFYKWKIPFDYNPPPLPLLPRENYAGKKPWVCSQNFMVPYVNCLGSLICHRHVDLMK